VARSIPSCGAIECRSDRRLHPPSPTGATIEQLLVELRFLTQCSDKNHENEKHLFGSLVTSHSGRQDQPACGFGLLGISGLTQRVILRHVILRHVKLVAP